MSVRPLRGEDHVAVSCLMATCGLKCSVDYIRNNLPSGIVVEDQGEIVGFCGIIPVKIWVGTLVQDAFQLGMLGVASGRGTSLLDLLDGIRVAVEGVPLVYANTANKRGAKVWTKLYGMKSGPIENSFTRFRWIVPWIGFAKSDQVADDVRWNNFISELRQANEGVMTARSVAGWQRLKATCVTICQGERILGAAFIRCRTFSRLKLRRFDIVDICAINKDKDVLCKLLERCRRVASMRGGLILEYVGAPTERNDLFDQFFTRRRPAESNTFVYDGSLDVSKGWFFGPYDGDRCVS